MVVIAEGLHSDNEKGGLAQIPETQSYFEQISPELSVIYGAALYHCIEEFGSETGNTKKTEGPVVEGIYCFRYNIVTNILIYQHAVLELERQGTPSVEVDRGESSK